MGWEEPEPCLVSTTQVMQNLPLCQVKPNGYQIHSETRVPWIHYEICLGSVFQPHWMLLELSCE